MVTEHTLVEVKHPQRMFMI